MFSPRLGPTEVARVVHAAYDAGITSFDTAPLYDLHRGEELLGNALRDRRDKVQLLTKAGLRWDDDHGRELFAFTDARGHVHRVRKDSRPASLLREVTASCRRLGTDRLDLVQIHQPDEDTPIAQSIEALSSLQQAGVIRSFGVSNYAPAQLTQAIAAAGPGRLASLQSEYSLLERWAERELLPSCQRHGLAFLAYTPLAKGALAGGATAQRQGEPRSIRGSRYDTLTARVALRYLLDRPLRELAHAHHASCAQVALAWLLAQPGVTAVIVGASSVDQARDVAKASELRLAPAELELLGRTCARAARLLKLSDRLYSTAVLGRALRALR
jgi:aryl-alcohol dehydrogenase-like predicted oxidoreductase